MKTSLIIGYTGQTGNFLLEELLNSKEFNLVYAMGRKKPSHSSSKLIWISTDFSKDSLSTIIFPKVESLFICFGTTIKTAKTEENFHRIDFEIPLNIANLAKENDCKKVFLISAMDANEKSRNFYLRTKGKLENALVNLKFEKLGIAQPGLLMGNRQEFRLGELMAKKVMSFLNPFFIGVLKKFKGIESKQLSKAMIMMEKNQKVEFKIYSNIELLNM